VLISFPGHSGSKPNSHRPSDDATLPRRREFSCGKSKRAHSLASAGTFNSSNRYFLPDFTLFLFIFVDIVDIFDRFDKLNTLEIICLLSYRNALEMISIFNYRNALEMISILNYRNALELILK
jgi:hypothetical protein